MYVCQPVLFWVKNKSRKMSEKQQSRGRKARQDGFTLIELLVVVSIMAMLMSILLPGLSRARESGKCVVCLSNMRQLTLAWNFYATDNEDGLCSPDTYWNDTPASNYWVADGPVVPSNYIGGTETAIENGALWNYTQRTQGLYKCKSDNSGLLRSYSVSNIMGGYDRDGITAYRTLGEILRPSEKMVFIDASSRLQWIADGFWPVDVSTIEVRWRSLNEHNITARHSDGCNVSFADFHCEHWRWKDARTVKLADWEIRPDEASDNNIDLERVIKVLK